MEIAGYCRIPWAGPESLPLDGAWRLARHVVNDTVDPFDFVDDAGRGMSKKLHAEVIKIRRHAVRRSNRAQSADIFIGAAIAHHAHRSHRQKHGKGLPYLVVKASLADLLEIDRIRPAQDRKLLACDRTRAADGKARPWKGMPVNEAFGKPEFAAKRAHLVLEEFAQRLNELQIHALGQAADIVMRLDGDGGPAACRHALDHIGVERALGQELGLPAPIGCDLLRLTLKELDE